jgi:hypothetical protein
VDANPSFALKMKRLMADVTGSDDKGVGLVLVMSGVVCY